MLGISTPIVCLKVLLQAAYVGAFAALVVFSINVLHFLIAYYELIV